jgi:hypothetical protein
MPLQPQKAILRPYHDPDRWTMPRYVNQKTRVSKCDTVVELGSELEKEQILDEAVKPQSTSTTTTMHFPE